MDRDVLLVIVGAGASYGCISGLTGEVLIRIDGHKARTFAEVRPPLAQHLVALQPFYNDVAARYERAVPVLDELRSRIDRANRSPDEDRADVVSLEEALADYIEGAQGDRLLFSHTVAFRFYLRDILWECSKFVDAPSVCAGATLYLTLVRELYKWATAANAHVCFVNFNYDLLLESALRRFGLIDETNHVAYVTNPVVSHVKPHGSVHWEWPIEGAPDLPADRVPDWVILNLPPNHELGGLQLARDPYQLDPGERRAGLPALALPTAGKRHLVWPAEHASHFQALKGWVKQAIVIGWRGLEPHFLPLLHDVFPESPGLLVAAGHENEYTEIRGRVSPGGNSWGFGRFDVTGFDTLLKSNAIRDFLA